MSNESNRTDVRINELNELADTEGIKLPWPAEVIVAMEDEGHVVDLLTGLVLQQGSTERISLTPLGEAVAVANRAWNGGGRHE